MIYLENTTSAQTVSIPRNDNGGTPSINPRSYQEGYNAGFEAGEDVGYGEGFASGYTSGYTSGETAGYNSGYSVGYDSGYTSGNTDGYNTGYASGETVGENNIISTFSAMTATTNGNYGSSAHPLSAITVDVPSGSTLNIETNKPFTATSNGNYTVTPSSGSVVVNDRFDSDLDRYYLTATTSGYPSTGYFELLRIEDEFDSSKGYIDIYIDDGELDYDNMWNPRSDADIDNYGNEIEIRIEDANRYVDYTYLSGTNFTYDAMSAVSLTVNVPSSSNVITRVDYICTNPLVDFSNFYIDTGIFPTTATTMRIKYIGTGYIPSAKILGYSWYNEEDVYNWASDSQDYRFSFYPNAFGFHRQYLWDYNNSRLSTAEVNFTDEGAYVDLTFGNNYVYNNLTNTYVDTGNTQNYQAITNIPIMVNVSVIKLQSLEIWQGETKVFDGFAAYDNNSGHIGLFDTISDTLVYNSALTMTYGTGITRLGEGSFSANGTYSASTDNLDGYSAITVNVPQTGYTQQDLDNAYASGYTSGSTDGYNDGYGEGIGDGEQNIINTFTAITATTNGVYGSTGHPLSSITVNVPQSGVTEPIISVTGSTWFVLDHIFQYGEKINIKHATFDYRAASDARHQELISGGQGEYLRIAGRGTGNGLYVTYGNTNKAQIEYILTDKEIELTPTEFVIDGVKVANVTSSTRTWNTNMVLFANTNYGGDSVINQTASVGEITITNSANTITAHYVPTLDENDVPCFYNTVSDNYIYAESGTPLFEVISGSYIFGYTRRL